MSKGLTSAGIKLYYGVETLAGTPAVPTRPTALTSYTQVLGLKEIPDMNPTPDTIETTTFDDTVYKTYTQGLKDLGGALSFTFNFTDTFVTAWGDTSEGLIKAYKDGVDEDTPLATWFCIVIPEITEALYFKGEPAELGLSGQSVNSLVEITTFIVPTNGPAWLTAPTV